MADKTFEFENVASYYENMKNILGDPGVTDSIAGILHNIDEDMKNHVQVSEKAIYGDLGKQLLLDWENTSSTFGKFIDNFDNWNAAVAYASGNYSEFVQKVQGLKEVNPLGMTSGGIKDAYTNTGYYSDFTQELIDTAAAYIGPFKAYNGIGYFDTNSVALEEQRKIMACVNFGINLVSDVLSVWGIGKFFSSVGKEGIKQAFNFGAKTAAKEITEEIVEEGAKVGVKELGEELAEGASKKLLSGANVDDIWNTLKGMNDKDKAKYILGLVDDGTIQSQDDLLKIFGGKIGEVKRVMKLGNYNGLTGYAGYRELMKNLAVNSGDEAAAALGKEIIEEAVEGTAAIPGRNKIFDGFKEPIRSRLYKVFGGSAGSTGTKVGASVGSEIVEETMEAGAKEVGKITLRERFINGWKNPVVRDNLSKLLGVSGKEAASTGAAATGEVIGEVVEETAKGAGKFSVSTMLSNAKNGLSGMSDSAIAKLMGMSTDDLVAAAAKEGIGTKQFAFNYIKSNIHLIDYARTAGTNIVDFAKMPGVIQTGVSSYIPRVLEDNVLSEEGMAYTTVTQSVYTQNNSGE